MRISQLVYLVAFTCLLVACRPDSLPQYTLTIYPLPDVKLASGLTYAWGSLWTVTDRKRHLVYRMSTDGKLQASFKLKLTPDSPILHQQGIKLDQKLDLEGVAADERRELLYVLSETNRLVLKVTPEGELVGLFPIQGRNKISNQGLEGIAYSATEDCLYVVEEGPLMGNKRIYRYTPKGEHVDTHWIKINYRLTGLCFKDGLLLALNSAYPIPFRHNIISLTPQNLSADPQLLIDLEKEFGLTQNYEGITADGEGNIYLINDAQGDEESRLLKLSPRK